MFDEENREKEELLDENPTENSAETPPSNEEKQKNTISADLIRGHINTIILRTLSERDKYGYEIIDEIEKKSHGQYELKQPTLYSALKRLENQGYIKAYWKTDEISAGGRRKYFTLTESGKEITEKNRAEWEYSRTVIDNLISDRDFDFSKPAPTPVDFKILKQSTSRVPTVKLEENLGDDYQANENIDSNNDDATIVAYSYADVLDEAINIDASDFQFDNVDKNINNQSEEIVTANDYKTKEETETPTQPETAYNEEIIAQQKELANQYNSQTFNEQATASSNSTNSEQSSQTVAQNTSDAYAISETNDDQNFYSDNAYTGNTHTEQPEPYFQQESDEQYRPSEVHEQNASYFRTEPPQHSAQQQIQGEQYIHEETSEQPSPVQPEVEPYVTDSEQYKKLHENYLKLLDDNYVGNGVRKNTPEYGENLDTDKLLYNRKPVTERDYKNLINDMYSQTLRTQYEKPIYEPVPEPEPEPAPEHYVQPAPQPQIHNDFINNSAYIAQSEESRRAENDGLKIFISDRQPKPNGKYPKNYNLGETLLKSATVTFIYLIIIFGVTLAFKSSLNVGYAYPFTIFAIACGVLAIFAVMALCGFGKNSVRPVTHGYIGISIVLTVIAILIVCVVAVLLNIDFSSATDTCVKLAIPALALLAAPLFTTTFYIFSK